MPALAVAQVPLADRVRRVARDILRKRRKQRVLQRHAEHGRRLNDLGFFFNTRDPRRGGDFFVCESRVRRWRWILALF